jgi:hypothetical protein
VKDSPLGWRVQLCTGSALALMATSAVRVDVLNNLEYGLTVSSELATILVLSAIGVVALPTAASILGWSRHLKLTTVVCVALTVWSAVNAYSSKQGAAILAVQSGQEKYMSAKADEKMARETLKQIKELGEVGELGKLQALASMEKAKACRKPKSDACKLAEADEKLLTARLSDAKARDKAQAILAEAKDEAKAGPAEASMVATVVAEKIGADTSSVARIIALALTGLGIAVTQMVALLGGQAASLIAGSLQTRSKTTKAPAKAKPQRPTNGGTKRPAPSNAVHLDAAKHSVKSWLDKATVTGGEMRGGEALKAYKRYAGRMAKDMKGSELQALLTEILGQGAVIQRTSGYIVQGVALKAQQVTPHVATC